MAKASSTKKAPSKTEVLNAIAEATQLSKKDVMAVLDALTEEIRKALAKKGPGQFTIPNVAKIRVVVKPATGPRKGRNPATGQEIDIPAKPASQTVRVRALKGLKDMIG